ncbi:hypothetical protein [Tranquillimonas alkanivorans]|uniref:Uncharacterized protein n=1 Tax=Tranquillimonas alkanivorans TaxID=441119 RepID=A0A1I5SZT8_9RHOB|nr:hypothetical protein [Tranquillimonas alkanivorans]SFP76293.1 hypothetical protein SAMN04488047_11278 [Tranquillimonas alkanivorans]
MTALTEYSRLEAPGIWRPAPGEQRRDVVVSVGDTSLVIFDMKDVALAHWSLPAVERLNPSVRPALYAPGFDADDELEIDDDTMIEAIERVRNAIARSRPREGRLRYGLMAAATAAVAALAVFWLPDALIRHTVSVVPDAGRAEIGRRLLSEIERVAGPPCRSPGGSAALDTLERRLFGGRGSDILVLPGVIADSMHLPGRLILLNRKLVEDFEGPEPLAGYVLAEQLRAERLDPLERLLRFGGMGTALRLLTTGTVPQETLRRHAEALMIAAPDPVPDAELLAQLEAVEVGAQPYALALDITGESTLTLIEADPHPDGEAPPLLSDGAWVTLQGICGG